MLNTALMTLERDDGLGPTIREWAMYEGVRLLGPDSHAARELALRTLDRLQQPPSTWTRKPRLLSVALEARRAHRRWIIDRWLRSDT